jgi:hypothetical protein
MDCRTRRRDSLHGPWPSHIEELQALYAGGWEIYRDLLPGGKHGDWIAKRREPALGRVNEITTRDVDSLARQLAAAEK